MSTTEEVPPSEDRDNRSAASYARTHPTTPEEIVGRPGDFPGFLFWRAALRWQRMFTAVVRPFNLTHVQWVVLVGAWLMELDDGPPSQRELAEHQGMDVMMTGQVLTALEKRGLIVRRRDTKDKRVRRVSVTPEGADLAWRSFGVAAEADADFFGQVDDPDSLIAPLRKLAGWDGQSC